MRMFSQGLRHFTVFLACALMASVTLANPQGGTVTSGSASISNSGNTTTINQSSQQAILQWNSFNISAHEKTQFIQPNSSSVALNRINPQQGASQIYGQLTSNGRIILINGAGIFFGPSARVDVGGLIASTADITNANFLAGKYIFDQPSSFHGSIINEGKIIAADYGLVALMGDSVSNTGVVRARMGSIVMGSGTIFTLDFNGDQLINFSVDTAASTASKGVANTGKLLADGGQILVSAKAAAGVLDDVIDMKGVAETRSATQQGGEIILSGDNNTNVYVSGKLNASGTKGGAIQVLGENVFLSSTASLNASGTLGGGSINVGGNAHGQGSLLNAASTTISAGAVLNASALTSGNGGNVIVWSNNTTNFAGSILAEGGAVSGNGGFSEVSGHQLLNFVGGTANLLAPHGNEGTLLLDPESVNITTGTTTGTFSGGNPNTYSSTLVTSILSVTDLQNALNTANVNVITGTSSDGIAGVGDITVSSPITWTSTNTLTLTAVNNIYLDANISAANGGLTLTAGSSSSLVTSGSEGSPSATGVTAAINVANFNLTQGNWTQINSTLPTFSATNNFTLNDNNVTFLRATNSSLTNIGTSTNPYQITDVYGFQGIGSNMTTLAADYELVSNINASNTSTWNGGNGFNPIGHYSVVSSTATSTPFSGLFNGQNYTVNGLTINYTGTGSGTTFIAQGIFSDLSGTIENTGFTSLNETTNTDGQGIVGGVVGVTFGGTLAQVYMTGTVNDLSGGVHAIGGLIGETDPTGNGTTTITNSFTNATVGSNAEANQLGGLIGIVSASSTTNISTSYFSGVLNNGGDMGGLVGLMQNGVLNISNSFNVGTLNSNYGSIVGGLVGGLAGSASTISNS